MEGVEMRDTLQIVDNKAKIALCFYSIPFSESETDIADEMFIKEKMIEFFESGKLFIGYDPVRKEFVTYPKIVDLLNGRLK
jgi:hypothetical protein